MQLPRRDALRRVFLSLNFEFCCGPAQQPAGPPPPLAGRAKGSLCGTVRRRPPAGRWSGGGSLSGGGPSPPATPPPGARPGLPRRWPPTAGSEAPPPCQRPAGPQRVCAAALPSPPPPPGLMLGGPGIDCAYGRWDLQSAPKILGVLVTVLGTRLGLGRTPRLSPLR